MRFIYLDDLKVILIAAIIAIHGVLGYAGFDQYWSYADVQETVLEPVTEFVLLAFIGPFALFMIALLFLVAGLLAAPSVQRKGTRQFVRDRLLRLGVPFAAFTLVLWPLLMYSLYHPLGEAPGSYWEEFLSDEGYLDAGPIWFVGVLLIFSLVYAALNLAAESYSQRRRRPPGVRTLRIERQNLSSGPRFVHLLLLAAAVAAASFLVRLAYPFGTETVTDLNPWEWPACVALFGLGIAASGWEWQVKVPDGLRRACRNLTLAAAGAAPGLLFLAYTGEAIQDMLGGWNWPALIFAGVESILSVFGPVWILGAAQQHPGPQHHGRFGRWGPALRRSSYAAFLVQGPVLIGLALALRPVPVPAGVKAVVVALGGVAGSFALGWLLIKRVPGLAKVL